MKEQHKPKNQLLLLEDIEGLGRSGEIVTAKPGFVRNFLLPQKKAVLADKTTISLQVQLKEEREKRAVVDRKVAEEMSLKISELVLIAKVKVDQDGKMYGSVTSFEVVNLLKEKGYDIKRQNVLMHMPIKTLGRHVISLRLKEGIVGKVNLDVEKEGEVAKVGKESA